MQQPPDHREIASTSAVVPVSRRADLAEAAADDRISELLSTLSDRLGARAALLALVDEHGEPGARIGVGSELSITALGATAPGELPDQALVQSIPAGPDVAGAVIRVLSLPVRNGRDTLGAYCVEFGTGDDRTDEEIVGAAQSYAHLLGLALVDPAGIGAVTAAATSPN